MLTDWSGSDTAETRLRRRLGVALRTDLQGAASRENPSEQHALWRLFVEGDPVDGPTVQRVLSTQTLILGQRSGLLAGFEGYYRSSVSILRLDTGRETATWVACDFGWADASSDHVGGPGNAAFTLARAIAPRSADLAIDLGTGCGVIAIYLSAIARHVIVTDINPRALAYAELTAALNDLQWDVRLGSYVEPVADESADLVVANPPYVLGNPDRQMTFRDSTAEKLNEFLITAIYPVLSRTGTAQFLGNWIYRDAQSDPMLSIAATIESVGTRGLVIERAVVDLPTYVDLWVEGRSDPTHRRWVDGLTQKEAIAVGTGIVSMRRTDGRASAEVVRMHAASEEPLGSAIEEYLTET